jgi:hypothetical protein
LFVAENEMDLDKQLEEAQNAAAEEADKEQPEETEKPTNEEPPAEEETNGGDHDGMV